MSIDPSQVNFENGVALVGGGTCHPTEFHSVIKHTSNLVGIDCGAQTIIDYGFEPDMIVGDLDSLSGEYAKKYRHKTIQILDQDRTDLDKAIDYVNAPFLLTVGVLGDRVDHGLGACNILLKYPRKNLLILNNSDLCFLAPPKLSLTLPLNERISLFPFKKMRGKSVGLNWEIDEIDFDPAGMTGISNYCIDTNIHMEFSTPDMIVIIPNSNLPTVIGELQETAFW
ncbi:MAG: thiamine diphosphokinase [Rhodobacteraceae bacterium]|nr:thiamine diphosphokinase [Paracoccaceae bacterium]